MTFSHITALCPSSFSKNNFNNDCNERRRHYSESERFIDASYYF